VPERAICLVAGAQAPTWAAGQWTLGEGSYEAKCSSDCPCRMTIMNGAADFVRMRFPNTVTI
jgi:hypothetical protein